VYANKGYINQGVPRLGAQLPTSFSTYKLPRTNPSLGAVVHVDALEPHEAPALTQELLMEVLWTGPKSHGTARVLIDTGCRVALLFRRGLVETLMPAAKPLRFTTASGAGLSGGEKGAILSLDLTISGARGPCFARVSKIFGYEADISGPDMIIGYPLLAQYGLLVDAGASCLRLNPGSSLSPFLPQKRAGVPKSEISRVEILSGEAENQFPESPATHELPSGPMRPPDSPPPPNFTPIPNTAPSSENLHFPPPPAPVQGPAGGQATTPAPLEQSVFLLCLLSQLSSLPALSPSSLSTGLSALPAPQNVGRGLDQGMTPKGPPDSPPIPAYPQLRSEDCMGKQVSPVLATTANAWREETKTNPAGGKPGDDPAGGKPGDASRGGKPEATEMRAISTENPSASCKPITVFEDGLQWEAEVVGVPSAPAIKAVPGAA